MHIAARFAETLHQITFENLSFLPVARPGDVPAIKLEKISGLARSQTMVTFRKL